MNEERIQWLLGMIESITNILAQEENLPIRFPSHDTLMSKLKLHLLSELNKTFIEGKNEK